MRATAASLLNNLDRAWSQGLISDRAVYRGLRDKLVAANGAHNRGKHSTEANQLSGAVNELLAQSGQGIDATTATRFIGWIQDLVASGG